MQILVRKQGALHRQWQVRIGEREYWVDWRPGSRNGPMHWTVQLRVEATATKPYWRKIKGLSIINAVREFESA